jgi:uncharacterized protein (DUF488 family)
LPQILRNRSTAVPLVEFHRIGSAGRCFCYGLDQRLERLGLRRGSNRVIAARCDAGALMRRDTTRNSNPFFTIGHSTRPVEEFIGLLKGTRIALLVDVRSVPRSRTNPQYNRDILPETLARSAIGYEHMTALGGLRARQDVPPDVNAFWQNQSFHNFADYALTGAFQTGLARLRALGHERRCAIMCAEAVWWRCHRRIIADYLIAAGESVFHIGGAGRIEPARMTEAAKTCADGSLVYGA